jgi:hypothetical protein
MIKILSNVILKVLLNIVIFFPFSLHPESYKYLKSFKKYRQELAERLFAMFNREIFGNLIPEDTEIYWGPRLTKTAGNLSIK